jgi:hypothetical protein
MLDVDLLVQQLRNHNHTVESVIPVPSNAGEYEFIIDGQVLSLAEVRLMLESDEAA